MLRKRKRARKIKRTKIKKTKMKKSKRMLKKDLKTFKTILLKLKEDMIDQIRHISAEALKKSQREAAGDISGYTIHMADVATDTYDREFSLSLAANDRELLYEINDSLKRIEDGKYGICGECNKSITKKRLKAIPYTRLCLKCQRSFEKR